MPNLKIQAAKNGAAQLSDGEFFLMVTKFKIKRGRNTGEPIYAVKMTELHTDIADNKTVTFENVASFLLSQKDYDNWIALLIQVSQQKLEGEKDAK
jgi:hypothetical protein